MARPKKKKGQASTNSKQGNRKIAGNPNKSPIIIVGSKKRPTKQNSDELKKQDSYSLMGVAKTAKPTPTEDQDEVEKAQLDVVDLTSVNNKRAEEAQETPRKEMKEGDSQSQHQNVTDLTNGDDEPSTKEVIDLSENEIKDEDNNAVMVVSDGSYSSDSDSSEEGKQSDGTVQRSRENSLCDYDLDKSVKGKVDLGGDVATGLKVNTAIANSCGGKRAGEPMSPMATKMQKLGRGKLSAFILRFSKPVGKKEMMVPEIDPLNDSILEGFGKSFEGKKKLDEGDASASEGEGEEGLRTRAQAEDFKRRMSQQRARSLSDLSEGDEGKEGGAEHAEAEAEDVPAAGDKDKKKQEEEDDDMRLVKVRNLPFTTTEGKVKKAFMKFGKVEKVETIVAKNKRPLGLMLVLMEDATAAEKAVDGLQDEDMEGRPMRLLQISASKGIKKRKEARYYLLEDGGAISRCSRCGEIGHAALACTNAPKQEVCNICAHQGHTFQNCPFMLCFNCQEFGHTSRDCPKPKASRIYFCTDCGGSNHKSKDCRKPKRSTQVFNSRCMNCGERGHLSCAEYETHHMKDVFCYNCGEREHEGYECKNFDADACIRNVGANLDGMEDSSRQLKRRQSTGSCYNCQESGHIAANCPNRAPMDQWRKNRRMSGNLRNQNRDPRQQHYQPDHLQPSPEFSRQMGAPSPHQQRHSMSPMANQMNPPWPRDQPPQGASFSAPQTRYPHQNRQKTGSQQLNKAELKLFKKKKEKGWKMAKKQRRMWNDQVKNGPQHLGSNGGGKKKKKNRNTPQMQRSVSYNNPSPHGMYNEFSHTPQHQPYGNSPQYNHYNNAGTPQPQGNYRQQTFQGYTPNQLYENQTSPGFNVTPMAIQQNRGYHHQRSHSGGNNRRRR